jgi:hypothetical protein
MRRYKYYANAPQSSFTVHCSSRVISDFRCEVDKICALLGYYAVYSGNNVLDIQRTAHRDVFL